MRPETVLTVRAPAKLNLHLEVLGRRGDGYHELRTLFQTIDLHDQITVRETPGSEILLSVEPAGSVPDDTSNLVVKAALALRRATGVERGAALHLTKRIPAGGGLGGGSSDAAATLAALNKLWQCEASRAELCEIAASLGSDVPYFLLGGLALGVGRGEEVYPLPDLPSLPVVVVTPDVEIATPLVYRRLQAAETWRRWDADLWEFASGLSQQPPWGSFRNDLQAVVTDNWPKVTEALRALEATDPIHAAVTGSGATVYGIYRDARQAASAAGRVAGPRRVHVGVTWTREQAQLKI
jgi:4-diphosphocytidyl-2-C-methyl-D-erythritol kinase